MTSRRPPHTDRQFRLLADAMPQLVWMADAEGTVTYYNSRATEYAGLSPDETGLWEWVPAVHPDDSELTLNAWVSAVRTRETYQCEHRIRMVTGEYRWHLSRGVPLVENGRVVQWFGTATDIHSVKTAEQELQAAARNKDEFLAVLAHELRNPLAPIRNALELLRVSPADESTRRVHAMLDRQVTHMVRLVEDLLEISRISRGDLRLERRRVPLVEVIEVATEAVAPAIASAGQRFERSELSSSLYLFGDPVRLAQAIGNLLSNAAKFTPAGGVVRLEVSAQPEIIEITVSDNGIGLDPAELEHIFGMFVQGAPRANEVRSGLGVGLALVRRVVEMHGGTVAAFSDGLGHGARFVVRLPVGY